MPSRARAVPVPRPRPVRAGGRAVQAGRHRALAVRRRDAGPGLLARPGPARRAGSEPGSRSWRPGRSSSPLAPGEAAAHAPAPDRRAAGGSGRAYSRSDGADGRVSLLLSGDGRGRSGNAAPAVDPALPRHAPLAGVARGARDCAPSAMASAHSPAWPGRASWARATSPRSPSFAPSSCMRPWQVTKPGSGPFPLSSRRRARPAPTPGRPPVRLQASAPPPDPVRVGSWPDVSRHGLAPIARANTSVLRAAIGRSTASVRPGGG